MKYHDERLHAVWKGDLAMQFGHRLYSDFLKVRLFSGHAIYFFEDVMSVGDGYWTAWRQHASGLPTNCGPITTQYKKMGCILSQTRILGKPTRTFQPLRCSAEVTHVFAVGTGTSK